MKKGWLINDTLTCIPGTKTFWHDLLEHIPNLEDRTYGLTPFSVLAEKIELAARHTKPDYIIRNASYFRKINLPIKTISLLQDIGAASQEVLDDSAVVVLNSRYTEAQYFNKLKTHTEIIPLGIDFSFFNKTKSFKEELGILEDSILFVGSSLQNPKGFNTIKYLIDNTNYNFCLVMKDDYYTNHPRVRVFNKVEHDLLLKIINSCVIMLCTSIFETQHLAGLEAAACDLPIVATNVGVYYGRQDGAWGVIANHNNFIEKINYTLKNLDNFSPREFFLKEGYDKKNCMNKWNKLIEEIT